MLHPVLYYRLKQLSLSGAFTYSKTVKLQSNLSLQMAVSPSPATDRINISSREKIDRIELFNASGERVSDLPRSVSGTYDISTLPSGLYFLRIMAGGAVYTEKVLVQR